MDEKFYNNAVDIQTKQIDVLKETVTLFENRQFGHQNQNFLYSSTGRFYNQ